MNREDKTNLVTDFERMLNSFDCGGDAEAFVSKVTSMHRTLQSTMIGAIIVPIVKTMAENLDKGYYDGRNEYACKLCKAMLKGLAEEFPHIADGTQRLAMI